MDILEKARDEIHIFGSPSKDTNDALIAEVERLRIEIDDLRNVINLIIRRLQIDIDGGSRPDEQTMKDMIERMKEAL